MAGGALPPSGKHSASARERSEPAPAKRARDKMELRGASLNPDLRARMADLSDLRMRLLSRPSRALAEGRMRRRQGSLLEVVTQVLTDAGRPLRVRDVHSGVEQLLGE